MKKLLKVLGGVVAIVLVVVLGLVGWLMLKKPAMRPASGERVELTPQRLERGRYLVHHAGDCLGCHSLHEDSKAAWPIKPGTEGGGGLTFDKRFGVPGTLHARNITNDPETGLGRWTDGEIMRAIREGVDRDGNALFPMMPYRNLREMGDEDVRSIVAYLRTMKPLSNHVEAKMIDFPVNLIIKTIPKPLDGPVAAPAATNTVAYGRYLTRISGCYDCHTPHTDKQELIVERAFSGGWEMNGPWGRNFTANLTPAAGTFIATATREQFIARFHAYRSMNAGNAPPAAPGRNSVMPWLAFSGMTAEDLGAIYDYLKTVPPIENKVKTFPDAS